MKSTTLTLLLLAVLFLGCKNTSQEATPTPPDAETTVTEESTTASTTDGYTQATDSDWEGLGGQTSSPSTLGAPDILGVYTNGWHDASYALFVDDANGKYRVWGVENEGMLPPEDELFDYPDDFIFVAFETFDFDAETMTFTSDWGKGEFTDEGVRFLEKEGLPFDEDDSSLLLYKHSPAYSNADLVGFYSGTTWHSQGYIVTLEEKDGKLMVMGAQTDGGRPTPEGVASHPEEYNLKAMPDFNFTDDNTRFTSPWGTGRVQDSPYGFTLVFDKLPGSFDPATDQEDIQVKLYRYDEDDAM
jgi:hypothetical protein